MNSLGQQPKNIRIPSVPMEHLCVHGIGHEHVRSNPNGYFIIGFSMKAKSLCFSSPKLLPVNLNRRRAGCERVS